MKIRFNIHFHTLLGQTIHIIGSIPELGLWYPNAAKAMQYFDNDIWAIEIELPNQAVRLEYRYVLKNNGIPILEEWNKNHRLTLTDIKISYCVLDYWQNPSQHMVFYSSAFTQSWLARTDDELEPIIQLPGKILLKVWAPFVAKHEHLTITGNHQVLGHWNPYRMPLMDGRNFPEWQIQLPSDIFNGLVEYKFCILSADRVRWETGDNRILSFPRLHENESGIMSGLQFRGEAPYWKYTGVSIPIFSLRTESSSGIGDFNDLLKMIDWAKITNQQIIQILPINDTTFTHTWQDSYPYNAISIYALHPIYIHLESIGTLHDVERQSFYKERQQALNRLSAIDYEAVDKLKWDFFREIFQQESKEILVSQAFIAFFKENKDWLVPYARYSCIRDKSSTFDLYYFIQFHAHRQLSHARNYARQHGIVLKGDIPIGICRDGIEALTESSYFNMNFQAGAPPDDFSVIGQNWGFPTYNWQNMETDNYHWWKKRFCKMTDYFDAYRIDHILGFFRIWQIQENSVEGLLGYFNPALPFSIDEIEQAGLPFRSNEFTKAHILEQFVLELFGEYALEVMQLYMKRIDSQHFTLKETWNTQRKIEAGFAGKIDEKYQCIRSGLFAVCNEVLFIEDANQREYYHPRISASTSYRYKELNQDERDAFDRLYQNYFYIRNNDFWKEKAFKHLTPLINATNMLVCGEDLGMIPHTVPEVMRNLQILSLEIERMPKESNREFTDLSKIPYLSVCTTSTHDMTCIRGWWKENKAKTQCYYNNVLKKRGIPPDDCSPEICEEIICNHLAAPSMLTIFPLQDWLSLDEQLRNHDIDAERINVPAHPRYYWRYRMHLTIEELIIADNFNKKIRELIKNNRPRC